MPAAGRSERRSLPGAARSGARLLCRQPWLVAGLRSRQVRMLRRVFVSALPAKGTKSTLGSWLGPSACSHKRKPQWGGDCVVPLCLPQHLTDQRWFSEELLTGSPVPVPCSKPRLRVPLCPVPPQAPRFLLSPLRCGLARGKGWCREGNRCRLFWRRGDRPRKPLPY